MDEESVEKQGSMEVSQRSGERSAGHCEQSQAAEKVSNWHTDTFNAE